MKAVGWKEAVGDIGSIAMMLKTIFNLLILAIYFIAVIMIANTLNMAVQERIPEFGSIRALGAQRSFLRRMQICETGIISFLFGGLGIITGLLIILFLRAAGIYATNEFLQLAFGGNKLSPALTAGALLLCLLELGLVTLLAVVFPLLAVGKITPLHAITRD